MANGGFNAVVDEQQRQQHRFFVQRIFLAKWSRLPCTIVNAWCVSTAWVGRLSPVSKALRFSN